jgi:hypothetical protein
MKWLAAGLGLGLTATAAFVVMQPRHKATTVPTTVPSSSPPAATPIPPELPVAPPPATVRARIRLKLTSRPTGAVVIDESTDKVLGVTPLDVTQDRGSNVIDLRLERPGFAASHLSIPLDRDFEDVISLEAQPRATTKRGGGQSKAPRSGAPAVLKTPAPAATPSPAAPPTTPTTPTTPEAPKPKPKVEKW